MGESIVIHDFGTLRRPSLWRVVIAGEILGLIANGFLVWVAPNSDEFAKVIGWVSFGVAIALIVSRIRFTRFLDDMLLLVFVLWMVNFLEYALHTEARLESQLRQCGFYLAFGLMALGAYVARRTVPVTTDD